MKDQILHLDPHDDYHSARDKMGWTQTQRVVLVWPTRGRTLTRRIDLLLLNRHAQRLGARLAVVTHDREVSDQARDLGVPVFTSIAASRYMRRSRQQRVSRTLTAPRPQRRTAGDFSKLRPPGPLIAVPDLPAWARIILQTVVFLAGFSALLALAYALVPAATIHLAAAVRPLALDVAIVADPDQQQVGAGGVIPARTVRVEIGPATAVTATTGLRSVPDTPAAGSVVFTNLVGTAAAIPQGTGVRTTSGEPVRFVTMRATVIEARVGATVEVGIRASEPGPAGNVGIGQVNAIDGPLGLQLAVTNLAATAGGDVAQKFVVTESDRRQLRDHLLAQLGQQARDTVQAQLQPGEFLAPESISVTGVLVESYGQSVGEQSDALDLTMRISVSGLAISEEDARQAARQALANALGPDEALLPAEIRLEREPELALDDRGHVHFVVRATGAAVPLIDTAAVRQSAAGEPIGRLRDDLAASLPVAAPPEVRVWPDWYARWFGRLPWLPLRIQVALDSGG